MPTHLDPAFLEPSPVAPVERDTETGDLFAQPVDEPETKDEPDELPTLRLVALEQLGRRHLKRVAQDIQGLERNALRVPFRVDQSLRGRDRHRAVARLRQRVGGPNAFRVHEFPESESHGDHATNVRTLTGRRNTAYSYTRALELMHVNVHIACMESNAVVRPLPPNPEHISAILARVLDAVLRGAA